MNFEKNLNKSSIDSTSDGMPENTEEGRERRLKSEVVAELSNEISILFANNEIMPKYFLIPKQQGAPKDDITVFIQPDPGSYTIKAEVYKKNKELGESMKILLETHFKKEMTEQRIHFLVHPKYEFVRIEARKEIEARQSLPPMDLVAFENALKNNKILKTTKESPVITELKELMKNRENKRTKYDLEILDELYLQIVKSLLEERKIVIGVNYTMSIPNGTILKFSVATDYKTVVSPVGTSVINSFLKEKYDFDAQPPYFYINVIRHGVNSHFTPLDIEDEYEKRKNEKNSKEQEAEKMLPVENAEYNLEALTLIRKKIIERINLDSKTKDKPEGFIEGIDFFIDQPNPKEISLHLRPSMKSLKRLDVGPDPIFVYFQKKFSEKAVPPFFHLGINAGVGKNEVFILYIADEYEKITGTKIERRKRRGLSKKI